MPFTNCIIEIQNKNLILSNQTKIGSKIANGELIANDYIRRQNSMLHKIEGLIIKNTKN